MTSRGDPADALAYVDDSLEPEARRLFEARLKADPELRREVALWESQNRAIHSAFGAQTRSPVDLGRASNENGLRRGAEAPRPAETDLRSHGVRKRRTPPLAVAKPRPQADCPCPAPSCISSAVCQPPLERLARSRRQRRHGTRRDLAAGKHRIKVRHMPLPRLILVEIDRPFL